MDDATLTFLLVSSVGRTARGSRSPMTDTPSGLGAFHPEMAHS